MLLEGFLRNRKTHNRHHFSTHWRTLRDDPKIGDIETGSYAY